MELIDTKTQKPWPKVMSNLKLQEIRRVCCQELRERDERRGIVGGKVTTTIADPNAEGKTKEVVDVVKQQMAHTGAELNALLLGRWATYCSKPQDLDAFVATTRLPKQQELEAVQGAAAPIEESLNEDVEPPKRSPGRPKKPEPVEA